jgi:hypothetical protein
MDIRNNSAVCDRCRRSAQLELQDDGSLAPGWSVAPNGDDLCQTCTVEVIEGTIVGGAFHPIRLRGI